ncbi:hypothetical protein LUZ62_071098 [Rhynchospora pubera]|uniref:HRDC domain-containing protein n=1 Tax=Rhynchospora pubera TaxID=906938 RepID=A0AAV8CXE2_9POAL|nr:hypothetical protein LUZ62_071098 [Rhynchospora pubera]
MAGGSREKTRAAIVVACFVAAISGAILLRRLRKRSRSRSRSRSPKIGGGSIEEKPQEKFKRVLADNSYSPFKHLKRDDKGSPTELHPYEEEITHLLQNPSVLPDFVSDNGNVPLDMSGSYTWVDTEPQLKSLAGILSGEKVFAVDTEQHSFRSFLGFTALMQISTVKEDFLIDTIALHDVMDILRPVFADPSICKVFHGADNDVIWLQRDFHIYVVNMFDTAKACEILSKPQKSLAYLLEVYCGVITDKTLQREDWRIRPLSMEMIKYARCDAHYLLYIANCLSSELHSKNTSETSSFSGDKLNFFFEASRRSNAVCMQLYTKETEPSPGTSAATSIFSRTFNQKLDLAKVSELKDIIWKLCAWRDLMARIHDESLRYVLSDQSISALAVKLPKVPQQIYGTMTESPSPIVVSHIDELHNLLKNSNLSIDDLFDNILEMRLDPVGCCPLSAYNYALLSQLSSKRGDMFNFSLSGSEKVAQTGSKRASRELFIKKFSCKSPVYHNCRIYASDGRLLCYCDRKKLEWYLQRDLAKMVENDPPAIVLLFEPKGRPDDEDNDFYIQSKRNICVSCGEEKHYIRYRIIPSCYRMHFPEHLKSHRSHDIVLLCVDCHEKAHKAAERYKRKVAEEFGVPLFVQKIVDSGEEKVIASIGLTNNKNSNDGGKGVSPLHLRTAAMALLRHGSSMPSERRDQLMETVKAYYGGREVSEKDLESALLVGMNPNERRRFGKKKGLPLTLDYKSTTLIKNGFPSNIGNGENNGHNNISYSDNHHNNDSSEACEVGVLESYRRLSLLGHGPHGKLVVEQLLEKYGDEGILQFCQKWREVFVEALQPQFLPGGWNIKHSGKRDFGDYSVYNPTKKV